MTIRMAPPYGQQVSELEALLSATGGKHAVATNTGTAALQVALRLSGVKPGMRVAMPSLSFIATANAVSYLGAIPVFCGCKDDLTLDPRWVPGDIGFVVPVSLGGTPCEVPYERYVEDAAGSLGSSSPAVTRIVSFNNNKIVSAGQGGAILTSDEALADEARRCILTYRVGEAHPAIGYNYRMADINARQAIGGVRSLGSRIAERRRAHAVYEDALRDKPGLHTLPLPAGSNGWATFLRVEGDREKLAAYLFDHGIETRPLWRPMYYHAPYRGCVCIGTKGDEEKYEHTMMLPHMHAQIVAERILAWRS